MPNEVSNAHRRRVSATQSTRQKQYEDKIEKFWFQQIQREAAASAPQSTESKEKPKEVKKQ